MAVHPDTGGTLVRIDEIDATTTDLDPCLSHTPVSGSVTSSYFEPRVRHTHDPNCFHRITFPLADE